jgi:hypothetical protein
VKGPLQEDSVAVTTEARIDPRDGRVEKASIVDGTTRMGRDPALEADLDGGVWQSKRMFWHIRKFILNIAISIFVCDCYDDGVVCGLSLGGCPTHPQARRIDACRLSSLL